MATISCPRCHCTKVYRLGTGKPSMLNVGTTSVPIGCLST